MLAPLQNFTGLNYAFLLNANLVLDALSIGNETRYINDSRTWPNNDSNEQTPTLAISPNCEASIWLVNDVHRIAITATKSIKQGHELYLDYGDAYWKNHPQLYILGMGDRLPNHEENCIIRVIQIPRQKKNTGSGDLARGINT